MFIQFNKTKCLKCHKKVSLSQRDEWWFKSIDDSSWLMILYWNTITDGLTNEGTDNGKSRVAFATQDHLRYLVLNRYFCQIEISRIVLDRTISKQHWNLMMFAPRYSASNAYSVLHISYFPRMAKIVTKKTSVWLNVSNMTTIWQHDNNNVPRHKVTQLT